MQSFATLFKTIVVCYPMGMLLKLLVGRHSKKLVTISQLHVSENILISFLIALTSRLDARKNVLQPMGIR